MRFQEFEQATKKDGWKLKAVNASRYQYIHTSKPGKVTLPSRMA
jgi:predicted RNA binding protein YcfA (HicA-like mRNA interferase family)